MVEMTYVPAGIVVPSTTKLNGMRAFIPAADAVMAEVKALGGRGGVIVTGPDGETGWSFNTAGMFRAMIDSSGARRIAIYGDE